MIRSTSSLQIFTRANSCARSAFVCRRDRGKNDDQMEEETHTRNPTRAYGLKKAEHYHLFISHRGLSDEVEGVADGGTGDFLFFDIIRHFLKIGHTGVVPPRLTEVQTILYSFLFFFFSLFFSLFFFLFFSLFFSLFLFSFHLFFFLISKNFN